MQILRGFGAWAAATLAAAFLLLAAPAMGAQGSACMPTVGVISGLTFSQDVTTGLAALLSSNSGNSAPANDCTAAPVKGQLWLNTNVTPNLFEQYDGTSWQIFGALDTATHIWTPPVGGGADSLTAATTTSLWTKAPMFITVSGNTAITGFGANTLGQVKVVTFTGTPVITYNATSLILPTAASITAAVGDNIVVVGLGGSNARVVAYQRANGKALAVDSTPNFVGDSGAGGTAGLVPAPPAGTNALDYVLGAGGTFQQAVPVGTVLDFAGSTAPPGYLLCGGQAIARTGAFAGLFAVIGTTYGAGNGTTTYNLPDARGRVVAGQDDMNGTSANRLTSPINGDVLGAAGGTQSHAITVTEMPAHTHSTTITVTSVGNAWGANAGSPSAFRASGGDQFGGTSFSMSDTSTSTSTGGGVASTIVQPTIIMNKIIRY